MRTTFVFDDRNPPSYWNDANTTVFLFGTQCLASFCLGITLIIFIKSLDYYKTTSNNLKLSYIFGIISIICSIILYFVSIFGGSSMYNNINWFNDYRQLIEGNKTNNVQHSDLIDSLIILLYAVGKITFYGSLLFRMFPDDETKRRCVIFVSILSSLWLFVTIYEVILIIFEDTGSEIAFSKTYNIFMINQACIQSDTKIYTGLSTTITDAIMLIVVIVLNIKYVHSNKILAAILVSVFVWFPGDLLYALKTSQNYAGISTPWQNVGFFIDDIGIFINFDESDALFYRIFCCFKSKTSYKPIQAPTTTSIESENAGNLP